ncbi:MAG: glycosyltransferase [Acidobacteriota bacterium]
MIVPAFQAGRDLDRNLPEVVRALGDGELIVVDDGSSDDTASVASRHGARVLTQPNRGPAAARNLGAGHARGDILVFLDADCRPAPGWLPALVAPLREGAFDAVKGAYLTEQASAVARLCQIEFEERYGLLSARPATDFVDSFSMAVRRSVFVEVGGFDETFRVADNEDVDLSYRLASRGHRIAFAPRAAVYHRHPDTLGKYLRLKVSRGFHRMRVYERYPGKALADSYTPFSLKLQVGAALAAPACAVLAASALLTGAEPKAILAASLVVMMAPLLSTLPFLARAARTEPRLLVHAPVFLVARAGAIALGVARRALRLPPTSPKVV